ncbi:MAG: hypothetical protein OEV30_06880 [Ignavibacteria bacterium]|nr:hypothetical protein [Ignavibacteria bacterium]
MMEQLNLTIDSLRIFWAQFASYVPQVIAAILILTVGWLVAKLVMRISIRVLRALKLDVVAEKSGIEDFLLKGGVRFTTVTLIANLIYWFIMFTVMLAVLNSLGLHAAAELFNQIILYLPNVLVAILVLVFGTLFAKIVRSLSFTYLTNIGLDGAEFISTIAQWAILLFVTSAALEQLSIGGQILISAFQIGFGALCLALALAFGLGGKETAQRVLDKIWKG